MSRFSQRKVVGLIGYPLKHSISPAFQQAAFDFHCLPVIYEAWEVPPENLGAIVARVRQPDCLGMNITIPHKEAALGLLDGVQPLARQIGAVNTVVNDGGRLVGHNTDAEGFLRALREDAYYEPAGKRVVLLGAGGVARAVVFSLIGAGAARIDLANRTQDRALALATAAREVASGTAVDVVRWEEDALRDCLGKCDLLVNATSVGMRHGLDQSPLPEHLIPPRSLVYDLVYNPPKTRLLHHAERIGARTLNGLPMLVYQGAAAFELWTECKAPVGLMMKRAADALAALGAPPPTQRER